MRDENKPVILCVEDEPDLLADIGAELAAAGYEPVLAADGLEALSILETTAPALILCDIAMPRIGGYELLRSFRTRRPDLADVPFIFLTALGEREEMISARVAGVDDYLVKPVDFDLMLASIDARLRQVARMRAKSDREMEDLRRAISALPDGDEAWSRATAHALDLIALGVVLVDMDGRVVFANGVARAFSRDRDGLAVARTVEPGDPAAARTLRAAISDAAAAARAGGDFRRCLPVGRGVGGQDMIAHVCSLSADRPAGTDRPAVAIFLSDPGRRPQISGDRLAPLFGLTPAEAEIALLLTEGCRREEIAERLGISHTTVAFHMRNLFQKTDTNRQADLVAVILVGLGPILPDGTGE